MIDIDRWDAMCLTLQQVRLQIGPDSACVRRYEATKHGKGRSHSEPASARTTHAHAHTHTPPHLCRKACPQEEA